MNKFLYQVKNFVVVLWYGSVLITCLKTSLSVSVITLILVDRPFRFLHKDHWNKIRGPKVQKCGFLFFVRKHGEFIVHLILTSLKEKIQRKLCQHKCVALLCSYYCSWYKRGKNFKLLFSSNFNASFFFAKWSSLWLSLLKRMLIYFKKGSIFGRYIFWLFIKFWLFFPLWIAVQHFVYF